MSREESIKATKLRLRKSTNKEEVTNAIMAHVKEYIIPDVKKAQALAQASYDDIIKELNAPLFVLER